MCFQLGIGPLWSPGCPEILQQEPCGEYDRVGDPDGTPDAAVDVDAFLGFGFEVHVHDRVCEEEACDGVPGP